MPPNTSSCGAATPVTRERRRSSGALDSGGDRFLALKPLKPEAIKTRLLRSQSQKHLWVDLDARVSQTLRFAAEQRRLDSVWLQPQVRTPPNTSSCDAATHITRKRRRSSRALDYGGDRYLGLKPAEARGYPYAAAPQPIAMSAQSKNPHFHRQITPQSPLRWPRNPALSDLRGTPHETSVAATRLSSRLACPPYAPLAFQTD